MKKKAITDEEGDVLLTGFERFFFFNSSIDDMDPDGAKIKKKKNQGQMHTQSSSRTRWLVLVTY